MTMCRAESDIVNFNDGISAESTSIDSRTYGAKSIEKSKYLGFEWSTLMVRSLKK